MIDGLPDDEQIQFSIPILLDDKGYLDRRCPNNECGVGFKVQYDDWLRLVRDEAAFCPVCGHSQEANDFATPEQLQYFTEMAMNCAMGLIDAAMESHVHSFNARQKPGFISISMSYERGAPLVVLPCEAAELLRQDICCERCICRFATVGASFFCPACRHNSGSREYRAGIENIGRILDSLEQLVGAMKSRHNEDAAENLRRSLLENALEDLATILQRRTETLFDSLENQASFTRDANVFQRLPDASCLWKRATGKSYEDVLEPSDWHTLNTMMQRRHKVGHKHGHVDQQYIEKSGDSSYRVGQRLVINECQVSMYMAAVAKLIEALEALV